MQANDLTSYFNSIKTETDLKRMITDHVKEDLYLDLNKSVIDDTLSWRMMINLTFREHCQALLIQMAVF